MRINAHGIRFIYVPGNWLRYFYTRSRSQFSADENLDQTIEMREEENKTCPEWHKKVLDTCFEVLEVNKKERIKRKGIEGAIELQDEILEKTGPQDLVGDLRNWRDRRK